MVTSDIPALARRTVLQKVRDIALTVMAVLVSLLSAVVLYVLFAAGASLAELGRNDADPAPAVTFDPEVIPTGSNGEECIGEVPPPGC